MKNREESDEEFFKKYEANQKEGSRDIVRNVGSTEEEVKTAIAYLIEHRKHVRDLQLGKLENETIRLVQRLKDIDMEKILEELECFKDVLVLHRNLIQENDQSRD